MPVNDFCDNFLIECLNKIALLDNTCILMGDFNIDLLKSNAKNVTSKFFEVVTSCFFVPYIQRPTRVVGACAALIDNIFMNSVEFVTVSGNLLCQLADHLLQFLVRKDFRVSYRPKHEEIFKRNYRFFSNNESKNEINQIDWKTLFDSHDMNLCFEKFLHILTCVFDDHAPIKKSSKKEKSSIDKPWIDNNLRHLMRVRDACFVKYCRAIKAAEKLKIHAEYKVLRNEVKMKTKQSKKKYYQDLFEKNKTDLSKTWEAIRSIVKVGRKGKRTPCFLKHNGVLLFNQVKVAETFNFFFTNIGPNIAKRIPKGRKSPMTYLNDEIVKIIKSFSNNKSAGPNSLPTPIMKNCADVLSFPISYLVNLSFTTGEFPNLCRIAKVIPLFKKVIPSMF